MMELNKAACGMAAGIGLALCGVSEGAVFYSDTFETATSVNPGKWDIANVTNANATPTIGVFPGPTERLPSYRPNSTSTSTTSGSQNFGFVQVTSSPATNTPDPGPYAGTKYFRAARPWVDSQDWDPTVYGPANVNASFSFSATSNNTAGGVKEDIDVTFQEAGYGGYQLRSGGTTLVSFTFGASGMTLQSATNVAEVKVDPAALNATWNGIRLVADYDTSTFDLFVNGTQVATGQGFINGGTATANGFTTLFLGPSTASTGPGNDVPFMYIDDVLVQSAAVPEPTTMIGLACVAGGLLRRRRR